MRACTSSALFVALIFAGRLAANQLADSSRLVDDRDPGREGLVHGYYNLTQDMLEDGIYRRMISRVLNDAPAWSPPRTTGTGAAGPLRPADLGPGPHRPAGYPPQRTNSLPNEEHWTIRRWVSDRDGTVGITWHMRKTNLNPGAVHRLPLPQRPGARLGDDPPE